MDTTSLAALENRWPRDQSICRSILDALRNIEDNLVVDQHDSLALQQFANDNNFTYTQRPESTRIGNRSHGPAWQHIDLPLRKPVFVHEVSGTLQELPFTMAIEYTPSDKKASSRSIQGLSKRSILTVQLPTTFPQLLLDSNKNDRSLTSTIPTSIKPSQLVELEGDFAQHFDFFVPTGLHIDALTVLAPNFMQLLIDSSTWFDVEFYGDTITLITRESVYTPKHMALAVQALNAQITYLNRLASSWSYTPTRLPFDVLEYSTFNGSVVKIGSVRLRPAALIALILLGFGLLGLVITLL